MKTRISVITYISNKHMYLQKKILIGHTLYNNSANIVSVTRNGRIPGVKNIAE